MSSVFDKVDVCDESSHTICHFDLVLPVDGATHVKEEIVSHKRVPDLQRSLDDSLRADHLPTDLAEVVNGPVAFFTKAAQVLFHSLEYLLRVSVSAKAMQLLQVRPSQKNESVQALENLFLSFHSADCCLHAPAPF